MADSPHLLATAQDVEATSADRDSGTLHGSGTPREPTLSLGSGSPVMPHNEHPAGELDRLYPSLVPPPDEGLDDGNVDARDGVYQHGMMLAEKIREKTAAEGRRKRPLAVLQRLVRQPEQPGRSVCGGVTGRDALHGSGSGDGDRRGGLHGNDLGDDGGSTMVVHSDSHRFVSLVGESISQALLFRLSSPPPS